MLLRLSPAALACGLIGLLSVPPAAPQQPHDPVTKPQDPVTKNDGFVLEAGEHAVRDLIDRAAKFLGRNYVFSEADFASSTDSKIMLQNRLVLDAMGCEEMVSQLAFTKGFAMIPVDDKRGLYEWINVWGPKRAMLGSAGRDMSAQQVRERRNLVVPVRVVLPLEHISGNNAVNQLRPFFASNSGSGTTLMVGSCGNALLVQGFAPEVASAIDMIEKTDLPPKTVEPSWEEWRQNVEQRLAALEQRGKEQAPK